MPGRAPRLTQRRSRSRAPLRRSGLDSGLASLEWLLIIAAVGGLAAVMVVAVQQLLDDATEVRADRSVRLLEANVLAAELSSQAAAVGAGSDSGPDAAVLAQLGKRCEQLAVNYRDAISAAEWTQAPRAVAAPKPTTATTAVTDPPATRWMCRLASRPA